MPTVKVTFDQTTNPWTILLDTNPIDIARNANVQSIHWHLAGNAYAGQFMPVSGAQPGFEWNGPKPPPFDPPTLSTQKKALTIKDHHHNAASKGEWLYILRVLFDGTVYKTIITKKIAPLAKTASGGMSILGSQNPTIKNN
jgi:hypothetical protein